MVKIELCYLRIDKKGRITIPEDVRMNLGLRYRDWVSVTVQKIPQKESMKEQTSKIKDIEKEGKNKK